MAKTRPRGRQQTPSFSCEFELEASAHEQRLLRARLEAARQLYNAVLSDQLKRLAAARQSPEWQQARVMLKSEPQSDERKARAAAFAAIREQYGLREYDAHKHPSLAAASWIRTHLDANTAQKVATRAFLAVEGYIYGIKGRPHCKPWFEPLRGIEGKGLAGIRFVAAKIDEQGQEITPPQIAWNGRTTKHGRVDDLLLSLIVDPEDPVQAHALTKRVKFVRLRREQIRGRERLYAQLVCEGLAYVKPNQEAGRGVAALDIGPSTVAVVSMSENASTEAEEIVYQVTRAELAPGLDRKEQARRKHHRRLDRQRRANNPANYNADKAIKPRATRQPWLESKRQARTRAELRELERSQAASRKNAHGRDTNKIIRRANVILVEKLSYRAFQKIWGRSVKFRAPGMFIEMLRRKAEQAVDGMFLDIPTHSTFLSSRCLCGRREKKSLSQRQHECGCQYVPVGHFIQRDEFSAFLALFAGSGLLDLQAARDAWATWGANCLLRSLSSESDTSSLGTALNPKGQPSELLDRKERGSKKSSEPNRGFGRSVGQARRGSLPVRGEPAAFYSKPRHRGQQIPPALAVGNS